MNPYETDLYGHELEAEHDAAIIAGAPPITTDHEFYRVQVPINGRHWRTVGSFACTAKAQDYARTLVNFRVLRATKDGGWELVVCHTAT